MLRLITTLLHDYGYTHFHHVNSESEVPKRMGRLLLLTSIAYILMMMLRLFVKLVRTVVDRASSFVQIKIAEILRSRNEGRADSRK